MVENLFFFSFSGQNSTLRYVGLLCRPQLRHGLQTWQAQVCNLVLLSYTIFLQTGLKVNSLAPIVGPKVYFRAQYAEIIVLEKKVE